MALLAVTVCVFALRAKVPAGQALAVTINGVNCPALKLGHNAAHPGGYHPYTVQTDIHSPPLPGQTFTLTTNGQVSRVLLGSIETVRSTP